MMIGKEPEWFDFYLCYYGSQNFWRHIVFAITIHLSTHPQKACPVFTGQAASPISTKLHRNGLYKPQLCLLPTCYPLLHKMAAGVKFRKSLSRFHILTGPNCIVPERADGPSLNANTYIYRFLKLLKSAVSCVLTFTGNIKFIVTVHFGRHIFFVTTKSRSSLNCFSLLIVKMTSIKKVVALL